MLSPSKFSFSFDPFNFTWHHVEAPQVWRSDPIVAKVGDSVVVAGGGCDFEDDPLAVEIYDMKTCKWRSCKSMPASLKGSAAPSWLAVATSSKNLFLVEKHSGLMHCFDLESGDWSGPHDLRPEPRCFYSEIRWFNNRLILVDLTGNVKNVEKVKIWEVRCEEDFKCKEIGEMPVELTGKLKSETFGTSSISMCFAGSFLYIYNPEVMEEVVVCQAVNGGECSWGSVKNLVSPDGCGTERLVFTCIQVNLEDLQRAMGLKDRRYTAVNV